jgi:hypothetical protein
MLLTPDTPQGKVCNVLRHLVDVFDLGSGFHERVDDIAETDEVQDLP